MALEPPYFVEADKGVPPLSSLTRKGAAEVTVAVPGEVLAGSPGCAGVAGDRRGSCSTRATRWHWSPATSSSRRTRTRPGRPCSSPRRA